MRSRGGSSTLPGIGLRRVVRLGAEMSGGRDEALPTVLFLGIVYLKIAIVEKTHNCAVLKNY